MIRDTYTKEEVMYIMEQLGSMYKYDYKSGLWNMQTHMAPGMIHEGTESLLGRMEHGFSNIERYAEQRKQKPLKHQPKND